MVNIQYVKDLSFEVPGAPQIYTPLQGRPAGQTSTSTCRPGGCSEGQNAFEVTLAIRAEARKRGPAATAAQPAPAPRVFLAELPIAASSR